MGSVANKRLAAQRRSIRRHFELSTREAERRSPEAAEKRARIRRATRPARAPPSRASMPRGDWRMP